MIEKAHEWIARLDRQSAVIADLQLNGEVDTEAKLKGHALNLANCDAHCRLLARAVDAVAAIPQTPTDYLKRVLVQLISRDTYGAFAELAAYEWLARCYVKFVPQIQLSSADVLGARGSTLDGKIEHGPYFDIKALGFTSHLASRLRERLQEELPDDQVLVTESWDVSIADFERMIRSVSDIAAEVRQKGYYRNGPLLIRIEPNRPITVSMRVLQPYRLAKENALYPFRDAQQFTRNAAFVLIYVLHPWFSPGANHDDFGATETTFTRSLARRVFMQFSRDSRPLDTVCPAASGATLGDASRLLSAVFFVSAWPADADPANAKRLPSWLYLNPRATYRLTRGNLSLMRNEDRHNTLIDDFADDDY